MKTNMDFGVTPKLANISSTVAKNSLTDLQKNAET